VIVFFGQGAAQGGDAGAQYVHGMGRGGKLLQHLVHVGGQAPEASQLLLVGSELGGVGQLAAKQQVRYFFKLAMSGQVCNVIAAIVQVVAGSAHGAQGRVAGRRAGEGDGFLWFEDCGLVGCGGHDLSPN
jgi:hypothetical protein